MRVADPRDVLDVPVPGSFKFVAIGISFDVLAVVV